MYKVNYYTLAVLDNGKDVGNIKQFNDVWYTEQPISIHEKELKRVLDIIYGENKYIPIITNIEKIKGHCSR